MRMKKAAGLLILLISPSTFACFHQGESCFSHCSQISSPWAALLCDLGSRPPKGSFDNYVLKNKNDDQHGLAPGLISGLHTAQR